MMVGEAYRAFGLQPSPNYIAACTVLSADAGACGQRTVSSSSVGYCYLTHESRLAHVSRLNWTKL